MTYSELIHRLFHINLFGGMKLGLDNCYRLQKLLNFPDRSFASVHVAGTNGKGSVVTKIAYGLEKAGYRVGLYTSPHISCFRERIRINGEMISEKAVVEILSNLFQLVERENIPATFFELTTFLAFLHFANENVDIAVLETGLGGRLDATNVVHPLLSVITSISLDHTETLGNTIEAIAREKAGIIKSHTPVVIGPHVPLDVIETIAWQHGSPCYQIKHMANTFEEENRLIAETALEQLALKLPLSQEAIKLGLEKCQPCRFEMISSIPSPIILDVAHNPDGLLHLFKAVQERFPQHPLRILFGLSKSKDISTCLKIIQNHGQAYHLVEATNGRGAPMQALQAELEQLGVGPQNIVAHANIASGVALALQEASRHQQILVVCGSFFIMSAVRQAIGINEPIDEIDLNERSSSHKEMKK